MRVEARCSASLSFLIGLILGPVGPDLSMASCAPAIGSCEATDVEGARPCPRPPVGPYVEKHFLLAQADEPAAPESPTEVPPEPPAESVVESPTAGAAETADSVPPAPQQEPRSIGAILYISGGAGYWPDLHHMQPDPSWYNPNAIGRPVRWGFNFDFGFELRAYKGERWDLFTGIEVGAVINENERSFKIEPDKSSSEARLLSTMIHVTPTIKLVRRYEWLRPYIGAGAGLYILNLSIETETGQELNRELKNNAFGGFVALGIDIPFKRTLPSFVLRLEDKVHYVDFGRLDHFSPESGRLTGPINVITVGLGLAF